MEQHNPKVTSNIDDESDALISLILVEDYTSIISNKYDPPPQSSRPATAKKRRPRPQTAVQNQHVEFSGKKQSNILNTHGDNQEADQEEALSIINLDDILTEFENTAMQSEKFFDNGRGPQFSTVAGQQHLMPYDNLKLNQSLGPNGHKTFEALSNENFEEVKQIQERSKLNGACAGENVTPDGGHPDHFAKVSTIITSALLSANFNKANSQVEVDFLKATQMFMAKLALVCDEVVVQVASQFGNQGITDCSLQDVQDFSLQFLMDTVRNHSHPDMMIQLKRILLAEIDRVKDTYEGNENTLNEIRAVILQNWHRDTKGDPAKLAGVAIACKTKLLLSLEQEISSSMKENHAIFAQVKIIPACILMDVMQLVQSWIEDLIQEAKTSIILFQQLQLEGIPLTPGGENSQYSSQQVDEYHAKVKSAIHSDNLPLSQEFIISDRFPPVMSAFLKIVTLSQNSTLLWKQPQKIKDLMLVLLLRSTYEAPSSNNGESLVANPSETIDLWTTYYSHQGIQDQYIEADIEDFKRLLEKCLPGDFEVVVMRLFKFLYMKLFNLTEGYIYKATLSRSMARTMMQKGLASFFKNRLKAMLILQELERFQFQIHSIFSGPSAINYAPTIDLKQNLESLENMPVEEWIKQTKERSKKFGVGGLPSSLLSEKLSPQAKAKEESVQNDIERVVRNARNAFETVRKKYLNDKPVPLLQLDKVYVPENCQASHVTITISGFLSEKDDKEQHWKGLTNHFTLGGSPSLDSPTAIYSLTWEASHFRDFLKVGAITAINVGANIALAYSSGGTALYRMIQYTPVFGSILGLADKFNHHRTQAKIAGKLLAISIALRFPFGFQTISLVGFSLGTQVIKSCLSTLSEIYYGRISMGNPSYNPVTPCEVIQNVTLMGGAVTLNKSPERWRFIFENIVSGEAKNVYSKADNILYLYSTCRLLRQAAGRNVVKIPRSIAAEGAEDEDQNRSNAIQNFDITKNVVSSVSSGLGHTKYMKDRVMQELLLNIDQT